MKPKTVLLKVNDHAYDLVFVKPDGFGLNRRKVAVYLNPETGMFTMTLPDEVVKVLSCQNPIGAYDMISVIREFDSQVDKYGRIVKTAERRKVIVVYFAYNYHDGVYGNTVVGIGGTFSSDRVPANAIGMDYTVLYRIGESLYDIDFDENTGEALEPQHRFRLPLKHGYTVMDWTQEREDFLATMTQGMWHTIARMKEFFNVDAVSNIDLAISANANLFLTAPQETQ